MNRKLIRPNLAEVGKSAEDEFYKRGNGETVRRASSAPLNMTGDADGDGAGAPSVIRPARRQAPPTDTNAEVYYYKKQIDSHTLMVVVLADGEEVEGTIEWYDRNAIKLNRRDAPNLMLLKQHIKYMYKAEERKS